VNQKESASLRTAQQHLEEWRVIYLHRWCDSVSQGDRSRDVIPRAVPPVQKHEARRLNGRRSEGLHGHMGCHTTLPAPPCRVELSLLLLPGCWYTWMPRPAAIRWGARDALPSSSNPRSFSGTQMRRIRYRAWPDDRTRDMRHTSHNTFSGAMLMQLFCARDRILLPVWDHMEAGTSCFTVVQPKEGKASRSKDLKAMRHSSFTARRCGLPSG